MTCKYIIIKSMESSEKCFLIIFAVIEVIVVSRNQQHVLCIFCCLFIVRNLSKINSFTFSCNFITYLYSLVLYCSWCQCEWINGKILTKREVVGHWQGNKQLNVIFQFFFYVTYLLVAKHIIITFRVDQPQFRKFKNGLLQVIQNIQKPRINYCWKCCEMTLVRRRNTKQKIFEE